MHLWVVRLGGEPFVDMKNNDPLDDDGRLYAVQYRELAMSALMSAIFVMSEVFLFSTGVNFVVGGEVPDGVLRRRNVIF